MDRGVIADEHADPHAAAPPDPTVTEKLIALFLEFASETTRVASRTTSMTTPGTPTHRPLGAVVPHHVGAQDAGAVRCDTPARRTTAHATRGQNSTPNTSSRIRIFRVKCERGVP
jgi:hypothetical protein